MEVRWGRAAERELSGAADYLEEQTAGLGIEFLDEVDRVASLLMAFPNLGVAVSEFRREALLAKFPYRLVYDLNDAGIRIIAVAHQKRRPRYWQWRVEEARMRYVVGDDSAWVRIRCHAPLDYRLDRGARINA